MDRRNDENVTIAISRLDDSSLRDAARIDAVVGSAESSSAGVEAFLLGGPAPDGNGVFSSAPSTGAERRRSTRVHRRPHGTAGGTTSSDRQGVFLRETDGTYVQIARGGQPGPGGGGVFTYFGETSWLNNAGDVAFQQQGNLTGIYCGAPLMKIARVSEAAPLSGTFGSLRFGGMNDAGEIAFHASMLNTTPPSTNQAIYRGDGESLVEIAQKGSPSQAARGRLLH